MAARSHRDSLPAQAWSKQLQQCPILLGAVAGSTIYIGLPLGRVRLASPRPRAFLNAASAGILVFLLFEILTHATDPVEHAIEEAAGGEARWGRFAALGLTYAVGFGIGLLGLLYLGRLWRDRTRPKATSLGPGAMAVAEAPPWEPETQSAAMRTGMGIAAGIGLHNFSEGLAIGQAANSGQLALAGLLIVGFALHNMTEGFGIVGPLAAARVQASWGWLGLAGLIGGGPTFLGTIIGISFSSTYLFVGCLAVAAGALLYVIGELLPIGRRLSLELTLWGLLAGSFSGWPPSSSSRWPAAASYAEPPTATACRSPRRSSRRSRRRIGGHAFVQNLRRGRYEFAVEEPANRRVAVAFDELALAI